MRAVVHHVRPFYLDCDTATPVSPEAETGVYEAVPAITTTAEELVTASAPPREVHDA